MATVLVVEDEPMLSLDISGELEDCGYDVLAAENADEAIGILETRSDVRAIFTDINMPGAMDGLKLAKAVRDRWPPVNIIITTALQKPAEKDMPSNSRFIAKPYRNLDVVNALNSFG